MGKFTKVFSVWALLVAAMCFVFVGCSDDNGGGEKENGEIKIPPQGDFTLVGLEGFDGEKVSGTLVESKTSQGNEIVLRWNDSDEESFDNLVAWLIENGYSVASENAPNENISAQGRSAGAYLIWVGEMGLFGRMMEATVVFFRQNATFAGQSFSANALFFMVEPQGGGNNNDNADDLILLGNIALRNGQYDQAINYFERAFQADNNNPRAIIYSALAHIARISIDRRVVDLFRDRFGFTDYPNRLNALFSNDWLRSYEREWLLGSFFVPTANEGQGGWAMWIGEDPTCRSGCDRDWSWSGNVPERSGYYVGRWVWNGTLICRDTNYQPIDCETVCLGAYGIQIENCEPENWDFTWDYDGEWEMVWTLVREQPIIETRSSSFPGLANVEWLRGANSWHSQTLTSTGAPSPETWTLLLFANLIDRNTNGLNDALDELIGSVFGQSYENALNRIARLRSTPNTRITLHRHFIEALHLDGIITEHDQIGWAEVNAMVSAMTGVKASLQWLTAYDWNTNLNVFRHAWQNNENYWYGRVEQMNRADLPFVNNFLKPRAGRMAAAKASFVSSITGIRESYSAIMNSDLYPKAVKDAHQTINEGLGILISSIQNGGNFWVPSDPTRGAWPNSQRSDVVFGMNVGLLFTEGHFSLNNLFETESNGVPAFFSGNTRLTRENYMSLTEGGRTIGMRFRTVPISSVVLYPDVIGENAYELVEALPAPLARILFEKYHNITR